MFDMVMQATFETLQFDHLPGFLAGRSVGLLPARSFDTEPENVGKGGDDRTGSEVDQEDMDSDISMEITTRCVSDGKVWRAELRYIDLPLRWIGHVFSDLVPEVLFH